MNLTEIRFKPLAQVVFTRDELALMMDCSANHYDGVCKEAGSDRAHLLGRPVIGFLRGMLNCEANVPGYIHSLTFGQLDTLAKILEVGYCFRGRPDGIEKEGQCISLGVGIRKVLIELNESVPKPKTFAHLQK